MNERAIRQQLLDLNYLGETPSGTGRYGGQIGQFKVTRVGKQRWCVGRDNCGKVTVDLEQAVAIILGKTTIRQVREQPTVPAGALWA